MRRELPHDRNKRAQALRAGMNLARSYRNPMAVEWAQTFWYMQGVRNFQITSWKEGRFRWSYETPSGEKHIRVEDTLKQYQRQLGLVSKVDLRPAVTARGQGLESYRQAACAQAVLDYLVGGMCLPKISLDAWQLSLLYGKGAVVLSSDPQVSLIDTNAPCARVTTVPPWQLLPDPARPMSPSEVDGIFYHRFVPYRWAKEAFKGRLRFPSDGEDNVQLNCRRLAVGEKIESSDGSYSSATGASLVVNRPEIGSGGGEEDEPWVELTEYWNFNEHDKVERYEVLLGDFLATKDEYKQRSYGDMPCLPIGVFGGQASGSWWDRSWVSPLIPVNMEVERMYSSLFKNVSDSDDFSWLLIPNSINVSDESLDAKGRPRRIRYEPDYTSPNNNVRPEVMSVPTSGDFPGRVAGSGIQLLDRLGNSSDLFSGKAPGRVDSASGLGLLYETVGIQTIPMAASMNRAFTVVYKALLSQAKQILGSRQTLPLLSIDDDLAGVVIDRKSGAMYFDAKNPLPSPDEVQISIRDQNPKMVEQQRQDLVAMRDKGQIDPVTFAWYSYKRNLELPAGYEVEIEEIRKCKYRNLMQCNDGMTPGGVQPSSLDMHEIQMKWMKRFMAQPIFQFLSQPVRDAFEQRYHFHEAKLGGMPAGAPYAEDGAALQEQMMNQMGASPDQWGSAGSMDPNALPPQLARMMQQADMLPQAGGAGPAGM